ncbi:MAG: ABC transporter permease [Rikenellaceae bacterium]|nr:ABC transporter permease [Rikenellaceae bacterium]
MSRGSKGGGFGHCFWREVSRLGSRPLYRVVCFGVPLFCALFMATIFGDGQMTDLPIGVVDHDFTASSRKVVRHLDSSPTLAVAEHYTSTEEALSDLRRGRIYGFVVIPRNFADDAAAGIGPKIGYYYQYALLSAGAQVATSLEVILKTLATEPVVVVASAMALPPGEIEALLMPITADSEPLFNPSLDYSVYLSLPFFFVMLQIVVLLLTVYSVGEEIKFGTAVEWLSSAGGNIGKAVVGKLLPQALALSAMALLGVAILSIGGAVPIGERWPLTVLYVVLLVVASQALALAIFAIYPAMGLTISVVSMVGSLGATLCGVTFPLGAMAPFVEQLALALPIRHFMLLLQGEPYAISVPSAEWPHIVALMAFGLLPLPLLPRLRRAIISRKYEEKIG